MNFFNLIKTNAKARAGIINTSHGPINTPVFMPVGTRGSVKTLSQEDLLELNLKIILSNTYHLYLRPGEQLIERVAGGLHEFISWPRAILTDSGGFQVFSLAKLRKTSEEGVQFRSHIDGGLHLLTPEKSIEIQKALGSDIVMAFDECLALPADLKRLEESVNLTTRWARRSKSVPLKEHQHMFGIVQGGLDISLRHKSLADLKDLNFDGLALGGLSVGEKNEEMQNLLTDFVYHMPADKPRYLMGVGTPIDILLAVKQGIDLFDCVLPTRNGRNGQAFTSNGPLSIKQLCFKEDKNPIDPHCQCKVCQRYSRAYIRHLYLVGEYLAGRLLTYHNIAFYSNLMHDIRKAILEGHFDGFCQEFVKRYSK